MAIEKKCLNCGSEFSVRRYRCNTALYCSYKCAAQFRKNKEYQYKHVKIEKKCLICDSSFLVDNISKTKNKKTCSVECRNKLQGLHLQTFPKSHPKPIEKLLPSYKKTCKICNSDFEIARGRNSRQQTCSKKCGYKLSSLYRKHWITKETFQEAVNSTNDTYELCDKLSCSLYTIMRRSKEFGIEYKKNLHGKVRGDGYIGYTNKNNHRKIYENHFNLKLLPKQGLHHIDGDKLNNEIDNIFLTNSVSEHSKIHGSLQRIAFELFKEGLIGFDINTKEYFRLKSG